MIEPTSTSASLTKRDLEVLHLLRDGVTEAVLEGGTAWVGYDHKTSPRTIHRLLRYMALSNVSDDDRGLQRYVINGTGRAYLQRPELADEVLAAVLAGQPFTLQGGQVVLI